MMQPEPARHQELRCVIFDMDGTLTRTNPLIFASFNHVAEKYLGCRLSDREIIALFGPPEEGGLERLLGPERVAGAMEDLCMYYREHHDRLADAHDGVHDVLELLKTRGVRLAVFTGKGNRTAAITLEALGMAQAFELVVSGSDVTRHKPDPEGIRTVLERFGVDAGGALMVGDGVADVKASRAAGVRVAAALWDSYDPEGVLRAGPDIVFHTVDEMHGWFRTSLT